MKQWLKDDRFVTEGVFPKEGQRRSLVHRKDELELPPGLAQAHWEKLCRT